MRGQARGVAVAITGLAGLLLAGCAPPDGIDGDLASGWSELPEPVVFTPEAGVCHEEDYQETSALADYAPIDCAEPHMTEIVHVGEFSGSAVDEQAPPASGSAQWREAFQECDQGAADYLGADFRYARLWLGVSVPSPEAWEGGARWFRCDVVAFDDDMLFEQTRAEGLTGALDEGSELRLGCFDITLTSNEESIEQMDPVGCDATHHAEFVGVWEAPGDTYLDGSDSDSAEQVHEGCREQVAEFVEVPADGDLVFRTGTIVDWIDEQDWDNGDRKFRCYLWLNGDEIDESLEGAGTSGLPVR